MDRTHCYTRRPPPKSRTPPPRNKPREVAPLPQPPPAPLHAPARLPVPNLNRRHLHAHQHGDQVFPTRRLRRQRIARGDVQHRVSSAAGRDCAHRDAPTKRSMFTLPTRAFMMRRSGSSRWRDLGVHDRATGAPRDPSESEESLRLQ